MWSPWFHSETGSLRLPPPQPHTHNPRPPLLLSFKPFTDPGLCLPLWSNFDPKKNLCSKLSHPASIGWIALSPLVHCCRWLSHIDDISKCKIYAIFSTTKNKGFNAIKYELLVCHSCRMGIIQHANLLVLVHIYRYPYPIYGSGCLCL